jgi:secreted trypsin-like serine protease
MLKRFLVAVTIATFSFAVLASPTPSNAVTNADGLTNTAPWLATIWVKDSAGGPDVQLCGGTLISEKAILTAAHCVAHSEIAYVQFKSASENGERRIGVAARLWHQRYSKENYINDIGVLILAKPITDIEPLKLPPVNDIPLRSLESLSVIGYGEDQNGARPSRAAIAKQKDMSSEGGVYFNSFNNDLMIAAGRYIERERVFSGACRGDSGGPLLSKFGSTAVILGVVSYGAVDCNASNPSAYTRVSAYLDWIDEALKAR